MRAQAERSRRPPIPRPPARPARALRPAPPARLARALSLTLAALAALTLFTPAARGDGFVIVPPTPERPHPTQLAVRYHHVDITLRDQVGRVRIDQVFRNLNDYELEGEYLFPIPEGAAVSDFVLYVDGRAVHAEALDATQALRIYEDLVRRSRDPALLEYAGREIFRARIYPFPPNGEREVELEYEQLATRQGGLYRFIYPLSTEKFSSRPLDHAYVRIDLEADRPISNAYCPSHEVSISGLGTRRLRVTWEESGTRPDSDLVLYYALAEEEMNLRLVPYRPDSGDEGYFMLLLSPGAGDEQRIEPRDVVFVIDCSGSMRGEKIAQARGALAYCLERLNPDDRFGVVAFASEIRSFTGELSPASSRWVGRALEFVSGLESSGGTNISGALDAALELFETRRLRLWERWGIERRSPARPAMIVFLTDGMPTEGEQDPARILAGLTDEAVRIFPFGLGFDVNAPFLDQLALEHGGQPSYVRPSEDVEARVRTFYDQVADPVMTDLALDVRGVRFRATEPQRLPDLFRGGQVVLFGRYEGSGRVEIVLSGVRGGRRETFRRTTELPERETEAEFVGRLWATRRVGSLLKRLRLYGEEPELVDEVRDLGLRFGLVTPYTSFLVDEAQPLAAEGWGGSRDTGWGHDARFKADASTNAGVTVDYLRGGRGAPVPQEAPRASVPALAAPLAESKKLATGQAAFELSEAMDRLASASSVRREAEAAGVRRIAGRTYRLEEGLWRDTSCPAGTAAIPLETGASEYFQLLQAHPELGAVLALGERVLFEADGRWYETHPAP